MKIDNEKILSSLNEIGLSLSGILKSSKTKKTRLVVAFDIIKKIRNNIYSLSLLPTNEKTTTSKNLIYRNIFADLITLLFLVHITDEEFEYSIKCLDIKHTKYFKEVLPLRLKLAKQVTESNEDSSPSEQEYLDRYYEYFREHLTNNKGEPWVVMKLNTLEKPTTEFKFSGQISEMHEILKDCSNNVNLKALSNLYIYYKYLSQTEHYSHIGRHYPFSGQKNQEWMTELNVSIYAGIVEVNNLLEPFINMNNNVTSSYNQ